MQLETAQQRQNSAVKCFSWRVDGEIVDAEAPIHVTGQQKRNRTVIVAEID